MIFEKKLEQCPFKNLRNVEIHLKPNNLKMILNENQNDEEIYKFLDMTSFCEKKKDTNEFDYKMKAGDAIIFDENGFHRGSTKKTDRLLLGIIWFKITQYLERDKKD